MLRWLFIIVGCFSAALFLLLAFVWYMSGWTEDPTTQQLVPKERDVPMATYLFMSVLVVATAVFWTLAGLVGRRRSARRMGGQS